MSIGVAVPAGLQAAVLAAADLQAQLTALASFQATVDFGGLSADITLAGEILASLQAALALGLTPPSVSVQFDIVAALAAVVQLQLNIVLGFINLFATAGVYVYAWDGQTDQLGAAVTTEFSGDATHSNAIILLTKLGATWTAMQAVFKTTP